jgi:hypothetical protein
MLGISSLTSISFDVMKTFRVAGRRRHGSCVGHVNEAFVSRPCSVNKNGSEIFHEILMNTLIPDLAAVGLIISEKKQVSYRMRDKHEV